MLSSRANGDERSLRVPTRSEGICCFPRPCTRAACRPPNESDVYSFFPSSALSVSSAFNVSLSPCPPPPKMLSFAIMSWDFIIIFLILGVFVPWRGSVRVRKLLAQPALSTTDRLSLYASTIAFQWLAAFIVAWRRFARGLTASHLALGSFSSRGPAEPTLFRVVLATLLLTALLCTTQFLALL